MKKCVLCNKTAHIVQNKKFYCAPCALGIEKNYYETNNRLRDKRSTRKFR